jgi:hypothetical protein
VLTSRLRGPLAAALALGAAVLTAVPACSARPAQGPARVTAAAGPLRCDGAGRALIPAARLRGFTELVAMPDAALPVHWSGRHPLPFAGRYQCGQFRGFVTGLAMAGRYRRQNDQRARRLGYTLGKWPLVPLTGAIVAQRKHQVLEIYEGAYQFSSASAAAAFLRAESGGGQVPILAGEALRLQPHPLAVTPAPGAVVTERLLGPHAAADERAIYVGLRTGGLALTLSFQGGQALSWRDVSPYWQMEKAQLAAIGNQK